MFHSDLMIITKDKKFSLFIYKWIYIYTFIYLFIYSLIYWVPWQSNIQFSLYFYILLYLLLYFCMYLAIFVCFSFYFGCIIIIVIFFRFLLTPQTAIRTPHTDPAFSEHPSDKASQRGSLSNAVAICPATVSNRLKCSPKLFWLCSWWDIFAWAYYEIAMTLTLWKFSARQFESVTEFPLLSSYKRLESIRCSVRNVKRFQNHFGFFSSWRNVWAWAHYNFAMLLAEVTLES